MCVTKFTQAAQEEIQNIFRNCKKTHPHITEKYIAEKLCMTSSTFNYQITVAENFSKGLYDEIINIFRKEEVIKEPSEAMRTLNNSLLETQTAVFHQLELMTIVVRKVSGDGRYDEDEKPLVKGMIESIRTAMNQRFDKMLKEVE